MRTGWAVASMPFVVTVWGLGCGGRQGLTPPGLDENLDGASASGVIGLVDLTQAPRQLSLTCDHGVGQLAFENPCQVGMNLSGTGGVGFHEVECHLVGESDLIAWSFVFPLSRVVQDPEKPLFFPADLPTPGTAVPVQLAVQTARVTAAEGSITFTRVDPATRAFSGRFKGTISWVGSIVATFTCAVDAALWGAPGNFE